MGNNFLTYHIYINKNEINNINNNNNKSINAFYSKNKTVNLLLHKSLLYSYKII